MCSIGSLNSAPFETILGTDSQIAFLDAGKWKANYSPGLQGACIFRWIMFKDWI